MELIIRFFVSLFYRFHLFFTGVRYILFILTLYYITSIITIFANTKKIYLNPNVIFNKDIFLYVIADKKGIISFIVLCVLSAFLLTYIYKLYKLNKEKSKIIKIDFSELAKEYWAKEKVRAKFVQAEYRYICLASNLKIVNDFVNGTIKNLVSNKLISNIELMIIDRILTAFLETESYVLPSVEKFGNNEKDRDGFYSSKTTASSKNPSIKSKFEVFKEISLLEHSINVAYQIIKNPNAEEEMGFAIISALSHDIGKLNKKALTKLIGEERISSLDDGLFNRQHYERGLYFFDLILEKFEKNEEFHKNDYADLEKVKFIIENHHSQDFNSIKSNKNYTDMLIHVVNADKDARKIEEENWIKNPVSLQERNKQLHEAIRISAAQVDSTYFKENENKLTMTFPSIDSNINRFQNSLKLKDEVLEEEQSLIDKNIESIEPQNENTKEDKEELISFSNKPQQKDTKQNDEVNANKEDDNAIEECPKENNLEEDLMEHKLYALLDKKDSKNNVFNNRAKLVVLKDFSKEMLINTISLSNAETIYEFSEDYICFYTLNALNSKSSLKKQLIDLDCNCIIIKLCQFNNYENHQLLDKLVGVIDNLINLSDKKFFEYEHKEIDLNHAQEVIDIANEEMKDYSSIIEFDYDRFSNDILLDLRNKINTYDVSTNRVVSIFDSKTDLILFDFNAIKDSVDFVLRQESDTDEVILAKTRYFIKCLNEEKYLTKHINTRKNYFNTTFLLSHNNISSDFVCVPLLIKTFNDIDKIELKNGKTNNNYLRYLGINKK